MLLCFLLLRSSRDIVTYHIFLLSHCLLLLAITFIWGSCSQSCVLRSFILPSVVLGVYIWTVFFGEGGFKTVWDYHEILWTSISIYRDNAGSYILNNHASTCTRIRIHTSYFSHEIRCDFASETYSAGKYHHPTPYDCLTFSHYPWVYSLHGPLTVSLLLHGCSRGREGESRASIRPMYRQVPGIGS